MRRTGGDSRSAQLAFSPKAEVLTLERNYRSTQPVLAAANAVIDLASEGFTKNLWSDRASAERPYLVNVADDTAQAGYSPTRPATCRRYRC
jgi:DNA helicase II / ATP-dependent DNA helicase PcrA